MARFRHRRRVIDFCCPRAETTARHAFSGQCGCHDVEKTPPLRSSHRRSHRKSTALSTWGSHLPTLQTLQNLRQAKPRLTNTAMALTATAVLATGAIVPVLGDQRADAVVTASPATQAMVAAPAQPLTLAEQAIAAPTHSSIAALSLEPTQERAARSQQRSAPPTVVRTKAASTSTASPTSDTATKRASAATTAKKSSSDSSADKPSSSKTDSAPSVSGKETSGKSEKKSSSDKGFSPDTTIPAKVKALDWEALAHCEATGNPKAYNPSGPYYGLYQFDLSTWRSVGGSGTPTQAGAAEQTYRAQLLYIDRGYSSAPWPVCGKHL